MTLISRNYSFPDILFTNPHWVFNDRSPWECWSWNKIPRGLRRNMKIYLAVSWFWLSAANQEIIFTFLEKSLLWGINTFSDGATFLIRPENICMFPVTRPSLLKVLTLSFFCENLQKIWKAFLKTFVSLGATSCICLLKS